MMKQGTRRRGVCRGQTSIDLVLAAGVFFVGITIVFATIGGVFGGATVDRSDTKPEAEAILAQLLTETLVDETSPAGSELDADNVVAFFEGDRVESFSDDLVVSENVGVEVEIQAIDAAVTVGPPETFDRVAGQPFSNRLTRESEDSDGATSAVVTVNGYAVLDGQRVQVTVRTWPEVETNVS